jgi:hypothetical protein
VDGGSADQLTWRTAERCNGGECIEIGTLGGSVLIRNAADPDGACVTLTRDEWRVFVAGVKEGDFDDL